MLHTSEGKLDKYWHVEILMINYVFNPHFIEN